jgi:hypothetical protein
MALKGIRKIRATPRAPRGQIIGLRLSNDDRRRFEQMARSAGVGVSTYARLVIEQYIEMHGPRSKS